MPEGYEEGKEHGQVKQALKDIQDDLKEIKEGMVCQAERCFTTITTFTAQISALEVDRRLTDDRIKSMRNLIYSAIVIVVGAASVMVIFGK